MKQITKGMEPAGFTEWKSQANEDWQPTYRDLAGPPKTDLHLALLREQHGLCCYCGRRIDADDSHIEHFRPQETSEELALAYPNLHASCIRETTRQMPLHCGHAKSAQFSEEMHISPLDPGCEDRFVYALNGRVFPRDAADAKASFMVDLLKLDIPFLQGRRAEALGKVFDEAFIASATADELDRLERGFMFPDAQGCLTDFAHVLAGFARQLS